jgi:cytochrome o ubiquinol oxidase operon protein cyoD
MSTDVSSAPDPHVTPTQPGHGDDDGVHVTLRGYLTGFGLSVVLTAIPFWLVMSGVIQDHLITALVIMVFAAAQIVVHMVFFLHMGPKVEGGWSMMALLFTLIILAIGLSGSIWVMYHLNANMMPMTVQDSQQLP